MGNVLRVLVIVIMLLSAVSLYFASELYKKRELLTKRNNVLEEQVIKLAKTVESADAAEAEAPVVDKDTSEVSEREITNVEKMNVLEGYAVKLEQQNLPTLDFGSSDKRIQLRSYFAIGADGKPEPDPVDQRPRTRGPGTMDEILGQLFERSKAQQANLNKTRAELTKMRELVADSVTEINKLKGVGRVAKQDAKTERERATLLAADKTELEARMTKLNAEKKELAAEVADAKGEVETLRGDQEVLKDDLAKLNDKYQEALKKLSGANSNVVQDQPHVAVAPTAGDKGKVIETNDELKFAIIELSSEAIEELLGTERQNALPQLEMNVRRIGRQSAAGEFVTRIKLRQAVRGKNFIVADILNDWQQTPVQKGDVVFF